MGLADTLLPLDHQPDRTRPVTRRGLADVGPDLLLDHAVQTIDVVRACGPDVVRGLRPVEPERGECLPLLFDHDSSIAIR